MAKLCEILCEQSSALQAGDCWLDDKDLGVQVGRAKHESPVLAGSNEGQRETGLYQQEPGPQMEGNDSSPSLGTC